MRKGSTIIYSGGGWDLTVRELMFSIVIILVMLTGGFFISEKISSSCDNKNEEYDQAIKIDNDAEQFQYGMRTNVGNAFVKGTLSVVDPVTDPDIAGEYAYIEVREEHYNQHTRQVAHTTTVNGKSHTYYTTETYYSWDYYDSWEKHSEKVSFLGVEFPYGTISMPGDYHIDTQKKSSSVRYKYYVINTAYDGVIYTELKDNTISNGSTFIQTDTLDSAVDYMVSSSTAMLAGFWMLWIVVIGAAVYGFCYLDNKWLEDE